MKHGKAHDAGVGEDEGLVVMNEKDAVARERQICGAKDAQTMEKHTDDEVEMEGRTCKQVGKGDLLVDDEEMVDIEEEDNSGKLMSKGNKMVGMTNAAEEDKVIGQETENERNRVEPDDDRDWETVDGSDSQAGEEEEEGEKEAEEAVQEDDGWETVDDDEDGSEKCRC